MINYCHFLEVVIVDAKTEASRACRSSAMVVGSGSSCGSVSSSTSSSTGADGNDRGVIF